MALIHGQMPYTDEEFGKWLGLNKSFGRTVGHRLVELDKLIREQAPRPHPDQPLARTNLGMKELLDEIIEVVEANSTNSVIDLMKEVFSRYENN